jgi:D-xylose 1-dehydrogenase (NADP+, D-xylono-1,5-lactone-forming)
MGESSLPSGNTLKWGLLGTARINRALIPPIRASRRSQLVGVASRSMDSARAYADHWAIPRAYGSYDELLAEADIDVVYIPLPNSLHSEWTIKAIRSGKHVLCEKPLALSVEEVEAMKAAATENDRVVTEAFMYRHHPQTLRVKELVAEGKIGELQLLRGSFTFNISNENDVRLDPDLGGGSVWDVGCYPISYSRFVVGREPIMAMGWQQTGSSGVDETFAGQLLFPNGVVAQFDCGFRTPLRAQIEIVGTRGSIFVPNPYKPGENEKLLYSDGSVVQSIKVRGQELYSGEVADMEDAILLGKDPRVSLEDSRANVKAICALLESANQGDLVTI